MKRTPSRHASTQVVSSRSRVPLRRDAVARLLQAAVIGSIGLLYATPSNAAPDCVNVRKSAPDMAEATIDAVRRASDLLQKKQTDDAITKLNGFISRGEPIDKAMIYFNLGVAYSEKEQYLDAAKAFATAIGFNVLPQNQTEQIQFNIGQLYVAGGQQADGITALQTYMAMTCSPITPEAHMFLASALAEQKRFDEALPQVDLALSKAKAPKESWLQFRLGVQYEMKQYQAAAETLLTLIAMTPTKPDYWKQLSAVLLEMEDKEKSLAVMALAEQQGFIEKPGDIMNLYNIYMMIEVPLAAGQLIETSIANGKLPEDEKSVEAAANAWINARESDKAEAALIKVAGMADRGEYYYRLGGMYVDQERWEEARKMLGTAVQKGGLKRPGEVLYRLAIANYRLGDLRGAIAALDKSSQHDETRRQAGEWLNSLRAELAAAEAAPVAVAATGG